MDDNMPTRQTFYMTGLEVKVTANNVLQKAVIVWNIFWLCSYF